MPDYNQLLYDVKLHSAKGIGDYFDRTCILSQITPLMSQFGVSGAVLSP
jgi:hypothetical protein